MKTDSYLIKVLIGFDQFANVLLGGEVGVTLSTRAYLKSFNSKPWNYFRKFVDFLFSWDMQSHCEKSYYWERGMKVRWLQETQKHVKDEG